MSGHAIALVAARPSVLNPWAVVLLVLSGWLVASACGCSAWVLYRQGAYARWTFGLFTGALLGGAAIELACLGALSTSAPVSGQTTLGALLILVVVMTAAAAWLCKRFDGRQDEASAGLMGIVIIGSTISVWLLVVLLLKAAGWL